MALCDIHLKEAAIFFWPPTKNVVNCKVQTTNFITAIAYFEGQNWNRERNGKQPFAIHTIYKFLEILVRII